VNRINWKELRKLVDARTLRERVALILAVVVVIAYTWLVFVFDVLDAGQEENARLINNTVNQINSELTRNQNIRDSYTRDPNAFIRTRITALEQDLREVDSTLLNLYGELILPQQMAGVLTEILQGETTLRLISFENLEPESLMDDEEAQLQGFDDEQINVYRHGLRMVFEGDYLETIRFLRRVEGLYTSFFWDNLDFEVIEYPRASITLNIFTLSTQRGFIGV